MGGVDTLPSEATIADDRLLAQIRAGDVEAFSRLYDKYCVRAYRVAYAVCGDHGQAEEAVQEGFFSVWVSRDQYRREEAGAASWILTLVRRRAIDLVRADSKHGARRAAEASLAGRAGPADVAGEAVVRAAMSDLQRLLASLPETQREVITLAFYGQLSHSEISTHLRLPPGTVKGRMRLGLQKLRTALDP